ncbi:pre-mRNA-splicing factor 38B-like isoform X2 [Ostrea edulis]|nr:pre-mRNA-splicing factor 38B-like isoform X2 [Ostrea edulis]
MCGGVRGVGAGGIVSSAYCLLYKLYTLKLTRKQLMGLITHKDSPYIRGLGFMYIRYCQDPKDMWDWYEPYLDDEEEIDVKAGGGHKMTMGEMVRQWMVKLEWYCTLFPRIPVPIQKDLMQKLKERPPQAPAYEEEEPQEQEEVQEEPRRPRHIPDAEVSFGEAERSAQHRNRSPNYRRSPRRSPPRKRSRSPRRRRSRSPRRSPYRRRSPLRYSPSRRRSRSPRSDFARELERERRRQERDKRIDRSKSREKHPDKRSRSKDRPRHRSKSRSKERSVQSGSKPHRRSRSGSREPKRKKEKKHKHRSKSKERNSKHKSHSKHHRESDHHASPAREEGGARNAS